MSVCFCICILVCESCLSVCPYVYVHMCLHVCDLMYMHGSVCKSICVFIYLLCASHHSDLSVVCGGHVENPQTSSVMPETDPEALEVGTRMFLYLHPGTQTTEKSTVIQMLCL